MQHTIQDSRDVGVADIDYHGNSRQVAQSSTQQGDYEPVLMDEDRPVLEDQDESENEDDNENVEECSEEEEMSSVQCSLCRPLRNHLVNLIPKPTSAHTALTLPREFNI